MSQQRISSRIRSMPPSGIREFFDIAETMDDVISLSVGEPDFATPPQVREAAHQSIEQSTAYTSNQGLFELRAAVGDHLAARYGVRYDPNREILITVGVSEGLESAALGLFDPGDEVIMADPYYVAYMGCMRLAGAVPVFVPAYASNNFEVTAEAIEAAITPHTRAILLGYPNNPTGAVMSREELQAIVDLAVRHDLLILSDEIYDRIVYEGEHTCIAALPGAQNRTVLLGGFSKNYAMTGWRVAYMAGPADLISAATQVHQYGILSAPTMGQFAALEALRSADADVERMRQEYDRRRRFLIGGLNALGLPTVMPKGAFYAFPQTSHFGVSSRDFAMGLLQTMAVAIVPGNAFGVYGEGYQRVSYASSMENLEAMLTRLETYLARQGWLPTAGSGGVPHHVRNVGQFAAKPDRS